MQEKSDCFLSPSDSGGGSMSVMECQYRIDDEEFEEAWELV